MSDTTDWFSDEHATFGDRLAAAREHAGLTQEAVALQLGVKVATLNGWEEDRKEPRANRLPTLAGICGISLTWLMTGRGEGPDGPPADATLGTDVTGTLSEMRALRTEIARASDKLGQLEKRLRKQLESAL